MASKKRESYFWTSYSDLMTSLFFVMLVLFVLTITLLHTKIVESNKERDATKEQLKKINEIEKAIKNIDTLYFKYDEAHKKHVLTTIVNFPLGISEMSSIPYNTKVELKKAGESIKKTLDSLTLKDSGNLENLANSLIEVNYLLIIEGQASKDSYERNYELSYERALALKNFWDDNKIDFSDNCEVIISGSGIGGTMRDSNKEINNQRFLIHIVPKPGIIEASN